MLVCGKKDVYKYLEKEKLDKVYLKIDFDDKKILDLLKEINKDEEKIEVFFVEEKELDDMIDGDDEHEGVIGEKRDFVFIILILIISSILLLFICTGIAFSLFDTVNKKPPFIDGETGSIVLNYSDVNGKGNGIYIENAVSISDSQGMKLTGDNNYFDFTVSGTTSNIPIRYYILLDISHESNLKDEYIKVYLTKINGVVEETVLDRAYKISDLKDIDVNKEVNKILYSKEVGSETKNFIDNYRLRMWISNDAENYYEKKYGLTVNVYAEGLGE